MKSFFLAGIFTLCTGALFAQHGYVRINTGYAAPLGAQKFGENHSYGASSTTEVYTGVYGTLGSGFSVQAAYGRRKNIFGWDLEVAYQAGEKNEVHESGPGYPEGTARLFANGVSVTPAFTITVDEGKVQPYMRVGPTLGFYKVHYEENYLLGTSRVESNYAEEYYGNAALGVKGSLGLVFNTGKMIQFFTEIQFASMSYAPSKGKIVSYDIDGENMMDFLTDEEKSFRFEEGITLYGGEPENYNRVKNPLPFGSIGIQAGIRITQLSVSVTRSKK